MLDVHTTTGELRARTQELSHQAVSGGYHFHIFFHGRHRARGSVRHATTAIGLARIAAIVSRASIVSSQLRYMIDSRGLPCKSAMANPYPRSGSSSAAIGAISLTLNWLYTTRIGSSLLPGA